MIGKTFGRYRVLEKLGQGGMGEVWLALDTTLDRRVALKFPSPVLDQDPTARKRFLREARSAAAFDHPYICSIHEVAEIEGRVFIAMEWVHGETVRDALAGGPFPVDRALDVASEIVQALVRAHEASVIHRDLKPSNIMLTSDGHVKVMDFGLAKRVASPSEDTATGGVTERGTRVGTLGYMSPEQIRGGDVDARSDIFSLGLVLQEMVTGRHPFKRATDIESANAILTEEAPKLSDIQKDLAGPVQELFSTMLAKDPAHRHQSAADLGRDLDACRHQVAAAKAAIEPTRTATRRRILMGAVAATVIVGAEGQEIRIGATVVETLQATGTRHDAPLPQQR